MEWKCCDHIIHIRTRHILTLKKGQKMHVYCSVLFYYSSIKLICSVLTLNLVKLKHLVWWSCSSLNLEDSVSRAPQTALQKGTSKSESEHLIGLFHFEIRPSGGSVGSVGCSSMAAHWSGLQTAPPPPSVTSFQFLLPSLFAYGSNDLLQGFMSVGLASVHQELTLSCIQVVFHSLLTLWHRVARKSKCICLPCLSLPSSSSQWRGRWMNLRARGEKWLKTVTLILLLYVVKIRVGSKSLSAQSIQTGNCREFVPKMFAIINFKLLFILQRRSLLN